MRKKLSTVLIAALLLGSVRISNAAENIYHLRIPVTDSIEDVILTIGDRVFGVESNESGEVLVLTEKEAGFLYVEVDGILTKYFFERGVVTGKEEVTPAILSFTGITDLAPGDDLWLRVNAEAVTTSGELTYQWYHDGKLLDGETNSVLNIKNVISSDSGKYSVEVSQSGVNGVVTRSSEKLVSVSELESSIKGPKCYNFRSGEVTELENFSTEGTVTYEIESEDNLDWELNGESICINGSGCGILIADDGVNHVRIPFSCNKEEFIVDGVQTDFVYDRKKHSFTFTSCVGLNSCIPSYSLVGSEDWQYDAPVQAGEYVVKLECLSEDDVSFIKYESLTIARRSLELFNPEVIAKEYDGSSTAELSGTLVGVLAGDKVKVVFPLASFEDTNAGTHKVIVEGDICLEGNDSKNYRLEDVSLNDLSGTILKKKVTITAVNQFSKEGDAIGTFTYTTSTGTNVVDGIKVRCSVTSNSKAGKYPIEVIVPKNKNYEFNTVDGVYTVLPVEQTKDDKKDDITIEDNTVYDNYFTEDEDEFNWEDWKNEIEEDLASDEDEDSNEDENSDIDDSDDTIVENEQISTMYDISRAIYFDGLYDFDEASVDANQDVLVLDYWITSTGVVTVPDGMKIKVKKGTWKTKLNLIDGRTGNYLSAKDYSFLVKCGNRIIECKIKKFVCDRETPSVSVSGLPAANETNFFNEPVVVDVNAVFGISGQKLLAYKLVNSEDSLDGGWKTIVGGTILLDQEFEGKLAVKAEDVLGNQTIVFSGKFKIDTQPPVIKGIEYGQVYYDEITYSVEDSSGVQSVLFDGKVVDTVGTIVGGGVHTMVVTDVCGNSNSITFTCEDTNLFYSIIHKFNSIR